MKVKGQLTEHGLYISALEHVTKLILSSYVFLAPMVTVSVLSCFSDFASQYLEKC